VKGKYKRRKVFPAATPNGIVTVEFGVTVKQVAAALQQLQAFQMETLAGMSLRFARLAEREPPAEPVHRAGKALGFRRWTLDGYRLLSANAALGKFWSIGINEAVCHFDEYRALGLRTPSRGGAPAGHTPPHPDCECGLYGWYDVPTYDGRFDPYRMAPIPNGHVYGAVTAWGQIEAHPTGFRSQYAEAVMLAYDPEKSYAHVTRVQTIAEEMGLPCVELSELAERAAPFGEPIPEELRPRARVVGDSWLAMPGNAYRISTAP
jgi:hypothetical protein